MITYVCGSTLAYSGFPYDTLPKKFWKCIEELMEEGDEILLGDSDFDHSIYYGLRLENYENISVMKSLAPSIYRPASKFKLRWLSNTKMIRKCDRMIAVWDGESQEPFLNMLLMAALGKPCRLYHLTLHKRIDISSIEDLAQFVFDREGLTAQDVEDVMKRCGFDNQMIEFTATNGMLHEERLAEIICRAPVSLKAKIDIIRDLQKKDDINVTAYNMVSELIKSGAGFELINQAIVESVGLFGTYLNDCRHAIERAYLYIDLCSYYLFEEWYDTDVFMVKSSPVGKFAFMKDVMDHVKRETEREKEEGGTEGWFRLELWKFPRHEWQTGYAYDHMYDFYIYNNEICWFESLYADIQDNGSVYFRPATREFFSGSLDMSIASPFSPGDIVNIDCTPFGPPFHALIIEGRDQFDCCMPQVLFKMPYTDRWALSALKHKRFYKDIEQHTYEPPLSPLYRLRSVREDELTEDDKVLVRISKDLAGNEEKGFEFWKAFEDKTDGLSDEEVIEIWDKSH